MKRLGSIHGIALPLLFGMPVLATIAGAGSAAKILFPLTATLLAIWLAERDPPGFVRLLLWTVILAPGLRHFVEWCTVYSQTNPIMLAPYMVVFSAAPQVALYLLNARRYSVEFSILIFLTLGALGLALETGELMDGLLAAMRWLAPIIAALYVCASAAHLPEMRESVHRTFRMALPIIALYGIEQFIAISAWDAYFMRMAPIDSIGFPVPFQVRVFATMNSPGSLAAMLGTGLLLLLPGARGVGWVGLLLAIAALVLTTQRAALGAVILAIVVMLLISRNSRLRRAVGKMAIAITIVGVVMLSIPGTAHKVVGMAGSIAGISHDESAQQRWKQYDDLLPLLDSSKLGRGLAWATNGLYVNVGQSTPLDSGLIDIFVGLGLPGGALFLAFLAVLTGQAFRICRLTPDVYASGEFAAATFGLAQLPFGSQHTSEHGIFLFLALGLLLARPGARIARSAVSRHEPAGNRGRLALASVGAAELQRAASNAVGPAREGG